MNCLHKIDDTEVTETDDTAYTEYVGALAALLGPQGRITPEYFADLGKELAAAQIPPRAIPYHDFTIHGWTTGELLPTAQAQAALIAVLAEEYGVDEPILERLDALHDAALDWQTRQHHHPTELSHALNHAMVLSGKSQAELARGLAAKNAVWDKARRPDADKSKIAQLPLSKAGLHYILMGTKNNAPSKISTYAISQVCKPPFSLCAIHENALRERADQLWIAAEREGDLGGLIKACRVRLGEGMETFAKRIGALADKDGFGTHVTCQNWEDNETLPIGNASHTGPTLYVPIVTAMKMADGARNGLNMSIAAPWFDAAKEATFRQAFTRAIQHANEGNFTCDLPSCIPVECPNPKSIECPNPKSVYAHLRQYEGNLSNQLINGQLRKSQ